MIRLLIRLATTTFLSLFLLSFPAFADEGMWTFDNPPTKLLKERYGFEPTQEWLDHIRLSSVRFNDGGSGSFVSVHGLVLTNHHVALGQLQKVSTKEKDYVDNGFFARTQAEELKCPDLELNVLMSMENVTEKVMGAVLPGMTDREALAARNAEIARIAKENTERTGLRSDIVTLYQGSEYWVYRYKKYTDIRLVMAPEQQIAFFGGDPDNFTYPRYDIDMAFFRVYENDQPVQSTHYLKWNSNGSKDGDLVFVSGHPGSTNRLQTIAQTEYQRDYVYPRRLERLQRRVEILKRYAKLGAEQERRALVQIFGIENSLKALRGEYQGLLDKGLMAKKLAEEAEFRALVSGKPEWRHMYGGTWDSVAAAIEKLKSMFKQFSIRGSFLTVSGTEGISSPIFRNSRLANIALTIVQYIIETKKPNGERLSFSQDANLASLKFRLFSPAPVYIDMEEVSLADAFQESLDELGANDPFVQALLGSRTPAAAAKELVAGTQLTDPGIRKKLIEGGDSAISISTDPFIVLLRKIEPFLTETRKRVEIDVAGTLSAAEERVGKARFAVYGKSKFPDATFTLRLSYGEMKGYPMNGTKAPAVTTLYGLYDRAFSFGNEGDFRLPQRYIDGLSKLNLATTVNFVSTCDIIGGNSGSPVINRAGELVGLIFDGNIESLPGRFLYSEEKNRAVAVHPAVMIESMRKLYDAGTLADELEGVKTEPAKEAPAAKAPKESKSAKTTKKKR